MDASLQIKQADPRDCQALCALVNSAYRGDSSRQGWTTEADLLDGIRIDEDRMMALLTNPDIIILKALFTDGSLAGCVHLELKLPAMYLGMLTVKPALQAAGIGAQLLQSGEEWAKEKGCTYVEMTVIATRKSLIEWYERKGYQQTGEQRPFPTDTRFGVPRQPLHFIVLKKTVSF